MGKKGGFFYLVKIVVILAVIGAGFFYTQKIDASQSILISEIQIYPIENRFIELYNPNDSPVNLTDWYLQRKTQAGSSFSSLVSKTYFNGKTIGANSYFLISRSSFPNSDIILSSLTLSEANTLQLKDANGDVVDKVGWGEANDCQGSCALSPVENQSLQRKFENNNFINTGNNGEDFKIENCPSPKAQSAVCQNEDSDDSDDQDNNATSTPVIIGGDVATSTNPIASSSSSSEQKNNFGDVLINELVSDPTDDDVEWIELYNKTYREIDLTGWWFEDGSKAKTTLSGNLGASGASRYKVIEKPAGNLNNSGDIIILYDASGKIIDQVAYGNWDDGNIENNAPAAADPGSIARKFDGCDTYNNLNDFAITLKPTKGASNIIQAEDEISSEAKAGFDFSSDILISEILPNPTGDDTKLEFIEIYNAGKREVNLTGWSLSNEDNKKINLEKIATSTIIKAGEYLAFFRPKTKIVLHNDQEQVKLFQPLVDKPFITVDYKNVKEGWSYNIVDYKIKGEWVWSETITPGAINIFKTINHAPEVEFNMPAEVLVGTPVIFDSSDTIDQDDDKLKFSWDFGDGFKNSLANAEHTYLKAGVYKAKLEVSDGQATSTKEKSIKVVNTITELNVDKEILALTQGEGNIIINEIFPNPEGADTGKEWVEFKNQSSDKINLLNWRIENGNGKYKFNEAQIIEPGAFYVLDNVKSKLAFKNADDVISLYNDNNELIDRVEYSGAIQDEAYALGVNNKWFWTTKLTPDQENVISLADSEAVKQNQVLGVKINSAGYAEIDLEKIRELEIGSLVKVKGVVAVEPGILGAQIFYIVSLSANAEDVANMPGMQIYNYKKDFPSLKVGDYIEISGELSQTQGEFRIKTKDKSDIKIIESKQPPFALALKIDEISEENIGQLLTITGEITDKKSTSLYVDDGNDEIFVYIKQNTGINIKNLAVGQKVMVTGILSKTQTGFRLLPRYQEDIVLNNSVNELNPQVLGEVASSEEWDLAKRDKKLELFKYLLIISGGIIALLAGLLIRAKRKS
ncbi:MAG: lamin tail domain-containing protein [Patescibacteria group bacterium]|jgi:hypothetical protein